MKRQSLDQQNWLLVIGVILLAVIPLIFVKGKFTGADNQATAIIAKNHPDYKPWFNPLFKPTSSEIESLLFALQAALGAGTIGYTIGLYKGRRSVDDQERE